MTIRLSSLIGVVALASCAENPPPPDAGNPELGIARYETTASALHLHIRGVADDGELIASVELSIGHVTDGLVQGLGRALVVESPGRPRLRYESLGLDELRLAPPREREVDAVLLDPYVVERVAAYGVRLAAAPPAEPSPSLDYGHGGGCDTSYDEWLPGCSGTGFTDCCLAHVLITGYSPQSVVCGNASPGMYADRACFAPPICTAGKAYATTTPAVGCDQQAQVVCPGGTSAIQANGKWLCRISHQYASQDCANKLVGGLGCATCWTASYDKNSMTYYTTYNSTLDYCPFSVECVGNEICEATDDYACGDCSCGDGLCTHEEDPEYCYTDCHCGNGVCDNNDYYHEDDVYCPQDC